MRAKTDPKLIEEFLNRSVSAVFPTKEALRKELSSGRRLKVYVGIDPTSTYVHLGHSTNYLLLERLHKLGHQIIVLVGDFTAMIGDPDKGAARTRLTKEEVKHNLATFKKQIGKVLPFNDKKNPIEFRLNSKWLAKLSFEDILELSSHFTVQQMIERDLFQRRLNENKPLYVHEFMYPLMQGYDSVAMEVDLEIGGNDQTFNMLAGRTLVKKLQGREKFVLATTLLVDPLTNEAMMSKSKGTGVALDLDANDMFGKVMALPDSGIIQMFTDCTRLSLQEIDEKKKQLKRGVNPRDLKLELAREIVRMYHSDKKAVVAQQNWISSISEKGIPQDLPVVKFKKGALLLDVLATEVLKTSKSDVRRYFERGAITNLDTNEKIADWSYRLNDSFTAKVGKHTFIKFTK